MMLPPGIGHVVQSLAGLVVIGYLGREVMEEMGWKRSAVNWSIAIFVSGSVIVIKYAWSQIEDALDAVSHFG